MQIQVELLRWWTYLFYSVAGVNKIGGGEMMTLWSLLDKSLPRIALVLIRLKRSASVQARNPAPQPVRNS
jgi:hypothetical protein